MFRITIDPDVDPITGAQLLQLPVKFREQFAWYGFDYNDPQFGKWVEAGPHGKWSYQWNKEWETFFNEQLLSHPELPLDEARSKILQKLDQMREGYTNPEMFPASLLP